jgi:hypothetical protein
MSLNRDALRACVYLQTLKEHVRRQKHAGGITVLGNSHLVLYKI